MADLSVRELEARYDELVQGIIEQLKRVLNDLKSVKENGKRARTELVRGTYYSKLRLIAETKRKNKLYFSPPLRKMAEEGKAKLRGEEEAYFEKIRPLEEEFMKLVEEKIEIDKNDYKTFLQDQQRVDGDIKKIEALLKYIQENTGNKKNRRALNTRAMHDQIKAVYTDCVNSGREKDITKRHQDLKKTIEEKADHILRELNALIKGGPP